MKTREQAETRALKLYPIHEEFDVDRLKELREAYLQGWEEAQQDKHTCGFCVKQATELKNEKHSESLDTKGIEHSELHTEKQHDKQTYGFCVEPKEVEMIECPDCNGEGTWYNDTSRQCTTYRGDCCGGCGYYVDCDTCNGTGEIEKEEE